MIADALQAEMMAQTRRMRRENALLVAAAQGTLTADHISNYLFNVRRLIQNTPRFLARAHERALALGALQLADHFLHKAEEEEGHAEWATQDLASISERVPNPTQEIVPAIEEFVELTLALADEDPELVLAYMFFNEGLIVMLGDEALSNLEERCGIPRSSVTVVDQHIRLDRDHFDEALATIDHLVGDPFKVSRMRDVVRECFAIFDRFGAQITEARHGRSELAAVHVPAA